MDIINRILGDKIIYENSEDSRSNYIEYHLSEMYYTIGCECVACKKFYSLIHPEPNMIVYFPVGGWCDFRRFYLESEEEFLNRVPDGILRWPKDHKAPTTNKFFCWGLV